MCSQNKLHNTICLSQIFSIPPKENSKATLHFRTNRVYIFTYLCVQEITLLPHLTQLNFFSYHISFFSVPTLVMQNDRSLRAYVCYSHTICKEGLQIELLDGRLLLYCRKFRHKLIERSMISEYTTSDHKELKIPKVELDCAKQTLYFSGVKKWTNIPDNIREHESIARSKKGFRKHPLNLQETNTAPW